MSLDDRIICKICGKKCHLLNSHLIHIHKMEPSKYLELFPGSSLASDTYRRKLSVLAKEKAKTRPKSHYEKMRETILRQYREGGREPWNKGKPFLQGEDHPMYGKHHSAETRRKMKKHHWSKTRPEEFREIIVENRPTNPTIYEGKFCEGLKVAGIKFIRQKKVGTYACDVYIPESNLIVEIDGHSVSRQRDEFIESQGFKIKHFRNEMITENLQECIESCLI